MPADSDDIHFMQQALRLAGQAEAQGEVPVGAVVVHENRIIASAFNQPIKQHDPSAHAEILALRAAGQVLGNYRLVACTLYVTLEPCPMCAMAMVHARIKRLVMGTADPRTGAAGSVFNLLQSGYLNHTVACSHNVLQAECSTLLKRFFQQRR